MGNLPFRGLGIFGSGWHRQNLVSLSLLVGLAEEERSETEERSRRASWGANPGSVDLGWSMGAVEAILFKAILARLREERWTCGSASAT